MNNSSDKIHDNEKPNNIDANDKPNGNIKTVYNNNTRMNVVLLFVVIIIDITHLILTNCLI